MLHNNPIENTHMRFCKDLLGVQRQTSNIGVLLELGRVPIMIYGKKNCVKNWARINVCEMANEIVISANKTSRRQGLLWKQSVINCLNNMGLGGMIRNQFIHIKAINRMTDIFHQEAFNDINRTRSKLRTYGKIKTKIGIEKYLFCVPNIQSRTTLSRICLSNHELMIEKGRHRNVDIRFRNCPFCPMGILEDEYHFLLHCKTFSSLRNELLLASKTIFPHFEYFTREKQFGLLLSDERIVRVTGTFLCKALKLRRFLVESHKNLI